MSDSKSLSVSELSASFLKVSPLMPVKIWLPGSRIYLTAVIGVGKDLKGEPCFLIKGNIEEGSVLETLC